MSGLQFLARIVQSEGTIFTMAVFVILGGLTMVSDALEMETKDYAREARLARLMGAGLVAFGIALWGVATVLRLLE